MFKHTHPNLYAALRRSLPGIALALIALFAGVTAGEHNEQAMIIRRETRPSTLEQTKKQIPVRLPRMSLTMEQRIAVRRKTRMTKRTLTMLSRMNKPATAPTLGTNLHAAAPLPPVLVVAATETATTPIISSDFPALGHTRQPFDATPNWGNMHSAAEWERTFSQMTDADFVPVPTYTLSVLTKPMDTFLHPFRQEYVPSITEKLYYSTIYCAPYTTSPTGEYTGPHCAVDLKVAEGTPVRAIGGGRVVSVRSSADLGNSVMIEHVLPDTGEHVVSIYGHLASSTVQQGQDVTAGSIIGIVGMTGNTSGPHLHLQIDRLAAGDDASAHQVQAFAGTPSRSEAEAKTINPIAFIEKYR